MENIKTKDIPGYEGLYLVTSCGKVWSYRRQKFLKPADNGHGYLYVMLCKDGTQKCRRINRLVAEAYIPNPEGKPEVNHLNQDKYNNCVNNLEWATSSENKQHSPQKSKPKIFSKVRCVETGVIYNSCADAARDIGIHKYGINNVLHGKQKTAGGYHWERYYEPETNKSL